MRLCFVLSISLVSLFGCVKKKTPFTGLEVPTVSTDTNASDAVDPNRPKPVFVSVQKSPTRINILELSVTFNEAVTGFEQKHIQVENAQILNFKGEGAVYTFLLVPVAQGEIKLSIPENVAMSLKNFPNVASDPFSLVFDSQRPSVVFTYDEKTAIFKARFNEEVVGFTPDLLTLTNKAVVSDFSGSAADYSFTIRSSEPFELSLSENKVFDLAGNLNIAGSFPGKIFISNVNTSSTVKTIVAPKDVKTSSADNSIWVVLYSGDVYKIKIDKSEEKHWTSAGINSGHRTYISEVGLLVGSTDLQTNKGSVYIVNDDTLPDTAVQPIVSMDIFPDTRVCVTSYTLNNQAYIGAAYVSPQLQASFLQIPISKTKRPQVDLSGMENIDVGPGKWGYSCYIDQNRKLFWSKENGNKAGIKGLDLNTRARLSADQAPNGAVRSLIMNMNFDITLEPNPMTPFPQSYALSGGNNGSLYSLPYPVNTISYDPLSKSAFISYADHYSKKITVVSEKCFEESLNCPGFDKPINIDIGALSSLNDGRVIGIDRGSRTPETVQGNVAVYLMNLTDPNDLSSPLNVEKIWDKPNADAYMYTDFTGATLYPRRVETSYNLRSDSYGGYNPDLPFSFPKLQWISESGNPEVWTGLKLSVRCYKQNQTPVPDYMEVHSVADANKEFLISNPACTGIYDKVDVLIEPINQVSNIFSKTSRVAFIGTQNIQTK